MFNAAQAYAGNWTMSGGVLDLNARAAVLTLNGHASFDFGTLTGFGGTLVLNGPAELGNVTIGGPDKLAVNGTLTQTGTIQFGQSSNPTAVIAAKASWLIDADSSILGQFGLITNNGVLWDRNGSGSAVIQAELVSTGTLIADSTLQLEGDSALSGTLSGTGLLDLSAGGITLESGLAIKVAALDVSTTVVLGGNLADANVVSQFAGNIDSAGYTLALSGTASLDGGVLSGGGTLAASGTTTVGGYDVTGAATLLISGTADQSGNLTVADGSGAGTLSVAAGAAYNILDDFAIAGAGTVIVAGKLTESGTGTAVIAAGVRLASAGLLTANDRTVLLTGGGSLAGTLAGTGNVDLAGGSFALAAGLDATSATLEVSGGATASLLANQSYGGDFISIGATLALGADTFSLTGTAGLGNNTVLTGSGTLVASASATLAAVSVQGSATLLLHGVAQQLGVISVGNPDNTPSTASFSIGNGGSDTLAVNAGIQGDGTLTVGSGGALIAASNGLSQISTTITDQGTIAANHGTPAGHRHGHLYEHRQLFHRCRGPAGIHRPGLDHGGHGRGLRRHRHPAYRRSAHLRRHDREFRNQRRDPDRRHRRRLGERHLRQCVAHRHRGVRQQRQQHRARLFQRADPECHRLLHRPERHNHAHPSLSRHSAARPTATRARQLRTRQWLRLPGRRRRTAPGPTVQTGARPPGRSQATT